METRTLAFALWLAAPSLALAGTIHVPADSPTIQGAIFAASPGDIVLVAPGVYSEHDIDLQGKAIQVIGEKGADETIIDAAQLGRVFSISKFETATTVIQGFTIQKGLAPKGGDGATGQPGWPGAPGGGMLIAACSPTVRFCTFRYNSAGAGGHGGAGLAGQAGTSVSPNGGAGSAGLGGGFGGEGGALYIIDGAPIIEGCRFVLNHTGHGGLGGDGGRGGNGYVVFPTIGSGGDGGNGGQGGSGGSGGAISVHTSSPQFISCTIDANYTGVGGSGGGGGFGGSGLPLGSAGVAGGPGSQGAGGGLRWNSSLGVVAGSTITNNDAGLAAGGIFCDSLTINSSIVWGNLGGQYSGNLVATYSDIEGGLAGVGNMNLNPNFVDTQTRNYHLQVPSPCIGSGDPAAAYAGPLDIDGQPRIEGLRTDMGSDEVFVDMTGTGEDLVLTAAINGVDSIGGDFALMNVSDQLLLVVDSPNLTFAWTPVWLGTQAFTSGATPIGTPSLPGVKLDTSLPGVLLDTFGPSAFGAALLPPGGLALAYLVQPGLTGLTVRAQSFVITPFATNGIYAASNAIDLMVQ